MDCQLMVWMTYKLQDIVTHNHHIDESDAPIEQKQIWKQKLKLSTWAM